MHVILRAAVDKGRRKGEPWEQGMPNYSLFLFLIITGLKMEMNFILYTSPQFLIFSKKVTECGIFKKRTKRQVATNALVNDPQELRLLANSPLIKLGSSPRNCSPSRYSDCSLVKDHKSEPQS